jgi:hypothetical protein
MILIDISVEIRDFDAPPTLECPRILHRSYVSSNLTLYGYGGEGGEGEVGDDGRIEYHHPFSLFYIFSSRTTTTMAAAYCNLHKFNN